MKLTLNICDDREEIVIYAKEKSPLVCEIEKLIKNYSIDIIGYNNGAVIKLPLSQIYCFSVEENKIFVYTQKEKLQIKQRLYEIEKIIDNNFVKINQSCIVNVNEIERFDASFAGSMMVTLKNGYKDYVSRRQLRIVKERIGF